MATLAVPEQLAVASIPWRCRSHTTEWISRLFIRFDVRWKWFRILGVSYQYLDSVWWAGGCRAQNDDFCTKRRFSFEINRHANGLWWDGYLFIIQYGRPGGGIYYSIIDATGPGWGRCRRQYGKLISVRWIAKLGFLPRPTKGARINSTFLVLWSALLCVCGWLPVRNANVNILPSNHSHKLRAWIHSVILSFAMKFSVHQIVPAPSNIRFVKESVCLLSRYHWASYLLC